MESRNKRENQAQSNRYTYSLCVWSSPHMKTLNTYTPPPADFRSPSLQSQPAEHNVYFLQ